jgi:hypothetical protein
MMKKILTGAIISSVALMALPNNELQLAMIAKAAEKKAVVLANMRLKNDTKEKFGTLYDEYQGKLKKQHMGEMELIADYAKNFKKMTDETSDKIIIKWMEVEEAELALKKEYILKFRKILPSADVIRYFQIENKIQALREAKTVSMIPLAQPAVIEKTAPIKAKDLNETKNK